MGKEEKLSSAFNLIDVNFRDSPQDQFCIFKRVEPVLGAKEGSDRSLAEIFRIWFKGFSQVCKFQTGANAMLLARIWSTFKR